MFADLPPVAVVHVKIEPPSLQVIGGNDFTLHCSYTYYYHRDYETTWVTVRWFRNTDPPTERVDSWYSNPSKRVLLLTANENKDGGIGTNAINSRLPNNVIISGSDASLPAINSSHSLTIHSFDVLDAGAYVCRVDLTYKSTVYLHTKKSYSPVADIQQGECRLL